MTPAAGVVVEDVTKRYGDKVQALAGVSLRLEPADFTVLTGTSGCGKSTLVNMIAGLDSPDSGRVLVDGRVVADIEDSAAYRRDVVGIVFQMHHLIPGLTAEENVALPLIPARIRHSDRRERARQALADVGLAGRREHRPSELSGGERQRVALARALVGRPRLLLADEPTGALDSKASAQVLELIASVQASRDMTVLLVTYDPAAGDFANRTLEMRDGRLGDGFPAAQPSASAGRTRVVDHAG
jgi:ABC-type lipoprotein export system ATPase subunit